MAKLTPMMRQYRQAKSQAPGAILLFRLGDFYEMFGEDAKAAAPILQVALTARQTTPMCGIPHHAAGGYIGKLLRAGLKVAICDQVEDPSRSKGIVRREITRIITPGTMIEEEFLDDGRNNYLAGVQRMGKVYGLAFLDISTGEFRLTETVEIENLAEEMERIRPGEILASAGMLEELRQIRLPETTLRDAFTVLEDWKFDVEMAYEALTRQFGTSSLDGFGCATLLPAVAAAGAVIEYARENLRGSIEHVRGLAVYDPSDFMCLDEATRSSLEVVEPMRRGTEGFTLFGVLKKTVTPMGTRALRRWLLQPLVALPEIVGRHDAVDELIRRRSTLEAVRDRLGGVRDLERLMGRISCGNPNARDLAAVRESLRRLPGLQDELTGTESSLLLHTVGRIGEFSELVDFLSRGLVDNPPAALKDGGIIKEGFRPELDELRALAREGRSWISSFQKEQIEQTGIKSLKVRFNKVFGYFIEVTNANLDLVPESYVRKQTLANSERFITEKLKEYEEKVLGAQEKAAALEYGIFEELRESVRKRGSDIQETAGALSVIDVLAGLAIAALENSYVRPEMVEDVILDIREGRHPVVEAALPGNPFVGNDTLLDGKANQLHIITGPNMAGKSTYIRQVALIVLMAQVGSFVPAASARIGCTDRIFARVGASDELTRGQSTFMVEMTETANILHHVSPRSLVILDEIWRGTSTFDGISIAWAVAEYLHDKPTRKARTLFATHYHELTELALALEGVKNYNVAVREWNDRVIFLHKLLPGATDKSYGIQVARLAGMPEELIVRASKILAGLEEGTLSSEGLPKFAPKPQRPLAAVRQLSLFAEEPDPVLEELRNLRLEHLTPFEALQRLREIKDRLR